MRDAASFDHEPSDISNRVVAWIAAGLGLFVLATPLVMPFAFPQSMSHRVPVARPALSSDAPPLAVTPSRELQLQRRGDDRFSETYGWTDRAGGVVRIPVARATELIAQRGLPGWPSP
jgi:hypothetical protein